MKTIARLSFWLTSFVLLYRADIVCAQTPENGTDNAANVPSDAGDTSAQADALYHEAYEAVQRGDKADAFRLYKRSAELGDPRGGTNACGIAQQNRTLFPDQASAQAVCQQISAAMGSAERRNAAAQKRVADVQADAAAAAAAGVRHFLCRTKNTQVANRNSGVPLDVDMGATVVDTAFLIPLKTGGNLVCHLRYADQVHGPVIQADKRFTAQEQYDKGMFAAVGNMLTEPLCYSLSIRPDMHVDYFSQDTDGVSRAQFVRIEGEKVVFGMEDGHSFFAGKLPGSTYSLNLKTGILARNERPYGTCRRQDSN